MNRTLAAHTESAPARDEPGSDAADQFWDVAVVGAGPAGALASRQIALAGYSVILIDRAGFPRDKVCGCCLSAAALSTLGGVGLGGLPERLGGSEVHSLCLAAGSARASLPVRGFAVSRSAFDLALVHEAIRAGARFLPQTIASVGASGELLVRARGAGPCRSLAARVVLAADGVGGSVLAGRPELAPVVRRDSRIGASTILPAAAPGYARGAIHMTIGSRGYVGAVRLEDDRLNIAAALDPDFIRASNGPGGAVATILAEAGMPPIAQLEHARFHATAALTRRRTLLHADHLLILGDAAGYVEPFTGEGIAWALASAVAIVPEVASRCERAAGARPSPRSSAGSWSRVHRRGIGRRQRLCRAVAWTLRHPPLAIAAVRLLSAIPGLAGSTLSHVARPYPLPEPAP